MGEGSSNTGYAKTICAVGPLFAEAVMAAARNYFEHRGFDTATE
jgi:hypothetical protein